MDCGEIEVFESNPALLHVSILMSAVSSPIPRRQMVFRWLVFIIALGGLSLGKYLQNQAQIALVRDTPVRVRNHNQAFVDARDQYWGMLDGMVNAHRDKVRERLDPSGAIARAGGWRSPAAGTHIGRDMVRDPATGRTLELEFVDDRLVNVWVNPLPFVNEPVRFWIPGEQIRKVVGMLAPLAWLVCVVGAYKERLLRRRLVQLALGAALISLASGWLEPPVGVRDAGFRVPQGVYVGLAQVLLTLPAIALLFRKQADTGKCPQCRYDLTGNQSGICPECGQATPAELRRRRREKAAEFARGFDAPEQDGEISLPPDEGSPTVA